jgi:hypothetical protein
MKFRLGCIGFKSIVTFQERNISDPIVKVIAELRQRVQNCIVAVQN